MIIKRQKFFTKADKIIFNKSKEFLTDLINLNGEYKAAEKLKNLSTRDKINLVKKLPSYINDKSLYNDKGLIEIPEEVFNSLKKSDYFKDQDITLDQFNRGLNKHFNLEKYNKDLVKYLKDPKNTKKISTIVGNTKTTDRIIPTNYDFINKRMIEDFNDKNNLINTKDVIKNYEKFNSKNVTGNTKPITPHEMSFRPNNAFYLANNPLRRLGMNLGKLQLKISKRLNPENKQIDEYYNMLKETDKQGLSRSGGDIYLPKDQIAVGVADHEYGHALNFERSRDKRSSLRKIKDFVKNLFSSKEEKTKKKEIDKLRNSLKTSIGRKGINKAGAGIDQLGEEAAASLRGLSRMKGDKQKAEKILADAFSSYANHNANEILKADAVSKGLI